jgi:hypothetical protein
MNWEGHGVAFQFQVHPWYLARLRKVVENLAIKTEHSR